MRGSLKAPRTREAAVTDCVRAPAPLSIRYFVYQTCRKRGDPGRMAFPGGHRETSDDGLRGAAMRETAEEIGLDLGDSKYLGALITSTPTQGRVLNMLIAHTSSRSKATQNSRQTTRSPRWFERR